MRRLISITRGSPFAAWLFALAFSGAVGAQTPAPVQPENAEQAAAQRELSKQLKIDAEKAYESEQAACYKKFLVNSCLLDAKKRYTQAVIDARNVDAPAREFQRELKRQEIEAKEAQREADRPRRESEQREQGESHRAEEAAKAAEREAKLAAKEKQAAEGRQKLADEKARREAKNAERAKKNAEQIRKNAEKKAREAEKAAERAKKEQG